MMGAAHGNLAGDAKLSTTAAHGFTSAPSDEKAGYAANNNNQNSNALGMGGGAARLGGLDANGNALTVNKRLPKEETV